MHRDWSGVGTALVTPFHCVGRDRRGALRRRWWRGRSMAAMHFLVPCGTTGETPTLTSDERDRVVRITVEVAAGRVPVLAGVGGYDTHEVAELAAHTETLGVQGILSVTPYYNKPTQEGLFQHYTAIADAHLAADHRLQRARPHRLQRRAANARPARRDPEHRRRQGSLRQHDADVRGLPRRAARTSRCSPATTRWRCR